MKTYPIHLIAGTGKGFGYSSLTQIGDISPASSLGQAGVEVHYNMANFNMAVRDHAQRFAEITGEVVLAYYFNSQSKSLNTSWQLPVNRFTPPAPEAKQIIFMEEDGGETPYTLTQNLYYCAPGLVNGTPYLWFNPTSSRWIRYHPGTMVTEIYNNQGQRIQKRDQCGNILYYAYNSDGSLNSIKSTLGNKYEIIRTVNSDGSRYETIAYSDQEGEKSILQGYQFDKNGLLLISTTSINGTDLTNGYKVNYKYSYTSPTLQIQSITQDDGTQMEFDYTTVSVPGNGFVYRLDRIYWPVTGGVTVMTLTYSTAKVGIDVSGAWQADCQLDSQSRLASVTQYNSYSGTQNPETTRYEYASQGQLSTIIRPDNSSENYTYIDFYGLTETYQQPNDQNFKNSYNISANRPLLASTEYHFPDSKEPVTTYFVWQRVTPSANPEDECDYQRYSISPEGCVTETVPNTLGLVQFRRRYYQTLYPTTEITVAPSFQDLETWKSKQDLQQTALSEFTYDFRGLVTTTQDYADVDEAGAGIADTQMSLTQQEWNDYGQCIQFIKKISEDEKGTVVNAVTTNQYDGLYRTTQVVNPLQETTTTLYSPYEDKSQPDQVYTVTVTRPNGRKEMAFLNQQSDWIDQTAQVPQGDSDSDSRCTTLTLDGGGRPIKILNPDGRMTLQTFDLYSRVGLEISNTGLVTEHQWDQIHRVKTDIRYDTPLPPDYVAQLKTSYSISGNSIKKEIKTNPTQDRVDYQFLDQSKRLKYRVNARNRVIEFQYDTLNREIARILYTNPLDEDQLATLKSGVDLALTPDYKTDQWTSTYYNRDGLGQKGMIIGSIDPDGWVTEYRRNAAGLIKQKIEYDTPYRQETRPTNFTSVLSTIGTSEKDALNYYFYNARCQVTISVDAEGYVKQTIYYASKNRQKTTRFYNKVDSTWNPDSGVSPPLPAPHPEDDINTCDYDLLDRPTDTLASDNRCTAKQYTNMGQVSLSQQYDLRYAGDPASSTDPDKTRTEQTRYDGWENPVQFANAAICQKLAVIAVDGSLTPEQKQQQQEALWQQNSQRYSYDPITNLKLKSTNTLNFTTIYYFDQERRKILMISPCGKATQVFYNTFNDPLTTRQYFNPISADDLAKLTGGFIQDSVLALLVEDSNNDIIQQAHFDQLSEQTSTLDPEQYQSNFTFNSFGKLIEERIPVQGKDPTLTIQHIFNPRNLEMNTLRTAQGVTFTVTNRYDNFYGQLTDQIDEVGALTQFDYDKLRNRIKMVNAVGDTRTWSYDARNRVLTDIDAFEQTTRFQYNQTNRTQTQIPPEENTQVITETNIFSEVVKRTDALGEVREYQHSPFGQVTLEMDELGRTTINSYDTENQPLDHNDPMGTMVAYTRNGDGYLIQETQTNPGTTVILITQYQVDTFGRPIMIIDPRGVISQQIFSQRSLMTQKIRDLGTPEQPGLMLTKLSVYNGQRKEISVSEGDEKDSAQFYVTFQKDNFNRDIGKIIDPTTEEKPGINLTSILQKDNVDRVICHTDPAGRSTWTFYNLLGQKCFVIDAAGGMLEWQYNALTLKSAIRIYDTALTTEELATITQDTTLEQIQQIAATKQNPEDTRQYFFYDGNQREKFNVKIFQDPEQPIPQGIVEENRYDGTSRLIQKVEYANSINADTIDSWTTEELTELMAEVTDGQDRLTVFILDSAGQTRFSVSPWGVLKETGYDPLGRAVYTIQYANFIPVQTAAGFSLEQMMDYATEHADPSQDLVECHVFNPFFKNKPDYTVKTIVGNQCAVTSYQHDKNGNKTQTRQYAQSIIFSTYDQLLLDLADLTPSSNDRVTSTAYDFCNRTTHETDGEQCIDYYEHDSLDNLTIHTDRGGYVWKKFYDKGKRLIKEISPNVPVATITQDTTQKLVCTVSDRVIATARSYDGVNNVLQMTVDAEGDDPRTVSSTYTIHNKPSTLTTTDVEVDDPTQAASLTARPVIQQNLVVTTIYNAKLKVVVEINEKGAKKYSVYDSLLRLCYDIDRMGNVTGYQRNHFGDVIIESKYTVPLAINFDDYPNGVPISVVFSHLTDSLNDRYTFFVRDKGGNPVSTFKGIAKPVHGVSTRPDELQGLLYCYPQITPSSTFYTQTNRQYDPFKNAIKTACLVTPDGNWSAKYRWFDRLHHELASAEAVQASTESKTAYRVTRSTYNTFNQPDQDIKFAGYFNINPDNMTLSQLDDYLSQDNNPKNRLFKFEYDKRGLCTAQIRENVTREIMRLNLRNIPYFDSYPNLTLTESYQYDSRGLKTLTIHEAIKDQETPTQECYYYDGRGYMQAHQGITFTTVDEKQKPVQYAPLIYKAVNAHGQMVMKKTFKNGASTLTIDPSTLPVPASADDSIDPVEIKQMDNRGLTITEQDPNGVLKFTTFTATREVAREYQQVTRLKEINIDEKRRSYDLSDHAIAVGLYRNNQLEYLTEFLINAFGETIGEGSGGSEAQQLKKVKDLKEVKTVAPLKIAPKKSTSQWPLYRVFDQTGKLINTNDQKQVMLHAYNLRGAETLMVTSATRDLSTVTPQDMPSIVALPYTEAQQTKTVRDPAKRALGQILPEYTPGIASQPQYCPLEFFASTLYPALSDSLSLSWTVFGLPNAQAVFSMTPTGGDESQKKQLPLKSDENNARVGVDVSAYQTGSYDIEMDFFLIDPATQLPTTVVNYTNSRLYFATDHNDQTTFVAPSVKDDHVLWLTGAVTGMTQIDLADENGVTLKRYVVQASSSPYQKWVDLFKEQSAHYTAKPVIDGVAGAATSAFVINTSLAPTVEEALSREIPFSAKITLTDSQEGELALWQTLPLDFQNTPVSVRCDYLDDQGGSRRYQADSLSPNSSQVAVLSFAYPVESVTALSITLLISPDEAVPLYLQQAPGDNLRQPKKRPAVRDSKRSQKSEGFEWVDITDGDEKEEKLILISSAGKAREELPINFPPRRALYIRGQAVKDQFSQPPLLQFKDVSQNSQAVWKPLACTGVTEEGIVCDVTTLSPGHYPFILPDGDPSQPFIFTIALNGLVFDSTETIPDQKPRFRLKTAPVQRQRSFALDPFNNIVLNTDACGATTELQWNDLDQQIQQTDAAINVMDSNGEWILNFRPVTLTHRNTDGLPIGTTKPAGNTEGIMRNEQNKQLARILGDGTVDISRILDGLSLATTVLDCRQKPTQRFWDLARRLTRQDTPSNNDTRVPLPTRFAYDEKNQRVFQQDPAQNVIRWLYNVQGDIDTVINPLGDITHSVWDRNHVLLESSVASGQSEVWTPDDTLGFFSVMKQYQDLSRIPYTLEYDYNLHNTLRSCHGGTHGSSVSLTLTGDTDDAIPIYTLTPYLTPGQNLRMKYDAGRLIEVNDLAQNTTTLRDYDNEDRLILREIYSGQQTVWASRRMTSSLNALGDEVLCYDTQYTAATVYDRNRNRRMRTGQVSYGPFIVQLDVNFYDYNEADQATAVDCGLVNGEIKITKPESFKIRYQDGVRYEESTQDGPRTIGYWDSGDLLGVNDTDGTVNRYSYYPAGYRSSSKTTHTNGDYSTVTMLCDANLFPISQNTSDQDGSTETRLTPDENNNIVYQVSNYQPKSGSSASYELDYTYVLFEDTFQIATISGTTNDDYGQKYTQSRQYYDSNGGLQGLQGVKNPQDDDSEEQVAVFYVNTYDNLAILKYQFPVDYSQLDDIGVTTETYFYSPRGIYKDSYSAVQKPAYAGSRLPSVSLSGSSIKMRFGGVRNTGRFADFHLDAQPRPRSTRDHLSLVSDAIPPMGWQALHRETVISGARASGDTSQHDDGEFVEPITKVQDVTVPDKHRVEPGETFASIAQDNYGDANFALPIALANGYSGDTEKPLPNAILTLPKYAQSNRNTDSNNLTYNQVKNLIQAQMYPPLSFQQPPKKKQDCTQTLLLVAISVVAIAASNALLPGAGMVGMALLLNSVYVGLVAGALDAGGQELLVSLHALKHFSLDNVIQTALTAGVYSGMTNVFGVDPITGASHFDQLGTLEKIGLEAAASGQVDLSAQLSEIAIHISRRIDIRQTLVAMADTAADVAISAAMPTSSTMPGAKQAAQQLFADIVYAGVNSLIGAAVMGGPIDVMGAFAQAIGSDIGQTIAGQLPQPARKPARNPVTEAKQLLSQTDNSFLDYHQAQSSALPQIAYEDGIGTRACMT